MRKKLEYYQRERRKGRKFSAAMHLLLLVVVWIGLPDFLWSRPPEEPVIITVELLPITGITNVKPAEKPPAEPKKEEEKKSEAKPSPPVKTTEAAPPPPEEKVAPPKEKEKEKEKKPEKKKEEKKPKKPKEEDLMEVLRAVKETAQKEKEKEKKEDAAKDNTEPTKSQSTKYDPGLPMTLSERDAIMSQLARCWNVPAGAKDAHELVVVLNAEYNQDGSYLRVELARESAGRYQSDSFFRAAADAAIRAVKQCSPLQGLPQGKYQTWRLMELRFDPKYMLN